MDATLWDGCILQPFELLSVVSLWPALGNKTDKYVQWGTKTEQDQYTEIRTWTIITIVLIVIN